MPTVYARANRPSPTPPPIESVTITMDPDTARFLHKFFGSETMSAYLSWADNTGTGLPSYEEAERYIDAIYSSLTGLGL